MTNKQDVDRFQVAPDSITTVIDKGVHIEGTIKVDSGKTLLIKGDFTGNLESNGVVIISQGSTCTGTITAEKLRVAGTIRKGGAERCSVIAKEGLLVERTGRLETDELSYSAIELQFGARISGSMVPMGGVDAPAQEVEQESSEQPAAARVEAVPPQVNAAPSQMVSTVVPMPGVPSSLLASRLNLDDGGHSAQESLQRGDDIPSRVARSSF